MTIIAQNIDDRSLDRLADLLHQMETPRRRRPAPTRKCCSAGGRATAAIRKLQKIQRLAADVEELRKAR